MSTNGSRAIGLIVGDITNPFFTSLAQGIGTALEQSGGAVLLVADCQEDTARQARLAAQLRAHGADAILITVPHSPELLSQESGPVVAIDRAQGVPYVSVDNLLGGRLATQHLLREGYARPGFLYAMPDLSPVQDRRQGYREALRKAGVQPESALEVDCGELTYDAAVVGAERLFEAGADAIFAINDVLASAALAAAASLGKQVPGDAGVVGYDDTPMAAWPTLNLTSVAQDMEAIGREAAQMVLRLVSRPGAKVEPSVLPPRLVVRASSRRSA
ncbi:MAG TPA: substrate-binding domain-containing protein [Candidatus Dormibacteraeota bacterium]